MRKYLNISVLCCLFALAGNVFYGTALNHPGFDSAGYTLSGQPAADHPDAAIFSTPQPFMIFAEISPESHSEILPERSSVSNHKVHEYAYAPRLRYLFHARSLITGQSPRNLIYPFHFFL